MGEKELTSRLGLCNNDAAPSSRAHQHPNAKDAEDSEPFCALQNGERNDLVETMHGRHKVIEDFVGLATFLGETDGERIAHRFEGVAAT